MSVGAVPTSAAPLFGMADDSQLVVRGTVERVATYEPPTLQVFTIRVEETLKGAVAPGESIALAQEILFPSTQPYFTTGSRALVFAVPLPNYSAFAKILPKGTYWRWTERLDGVAELQGIADPAVVTAVGRYLATHDDAEAAAKLLAATLTAPEARLRSDALAEIERRPEIPPLLDTARIAPLEPWLQNAAVPLTDRAQVLVRLARLQAPGMIALAEARGAAAGPLQAPAIDALVSLDRPPPIERLLSYAGGSDEALRVAAARGLAKAGSPAALDRLEEMLERDPSANVRLAILQALEGVASERAVGMLAGALTRPERDQVTAAAQALGRIASPEAIRALGAALEGGSPDAKAAAVFALQRSGKRDAREILETQEKSHPDPNVRRLCRLALGESMHEH